MRRVLLTAALTTLTPLLAQGAVITWGTAQNITGDSDVLTQGTAVLAENFGNATNATTTVNGVTFTKAPAFTTGASGSNPLGPVYFNSGGASAYDSFGDNYYTNFNALSPAYKTLLVGGLYSLGGTGFSVSSLQNLTLGQKYAVQIFVQDVRGFGQTVNAYDGANRTGNSVTLLTGTNIVGNYAAANGLGQYVIGTFTADATSQYLTFNGNGSVNGYQVRTAPVPEPASLALFTGVAGMVLIRRRSSR